MTATPRIAHDDSLRRMVAEMVAGQPGMREAKMFGCPAFFLGRRLVACIYEAEVGVKLPEARVLSLLARDDVTPFQPYGKATMREWIAVHPREGNRAFLTTVLLEATDYARIRAT